MRDIRPVKALVVDDSAFMRTVLKDILASKGFSDVYEAKDGLEAIEIFRKRKPDLVTMDIVMPGVDGMEALKAILDIDQEAKIIMVSSVGQQDVVQEAMKLGARDYVVKPFEGPTVGKVVDRVLKTT